MTFKGFGKAPEPTQPSLSDAQLKTLIDTAMKGDETAMFHFQKLGKMKSMRNQINRVHFDLQREQYNLYSQKEGSTMIHEDDYVPMNCCLCGARMETIHDTHNPAPLAPHCYAKEALLDSLPHRCCSKCDIKVIGARMSRFV